MIFCRRVKNHPGMLPNIPSNSEKPLHGDAFIQILDCMLSELDRRFSDDAKVILQGVSALSPTSESFLGHSALKEIALRSEPLLSKTNYWGKS